MSIPQVGGPQGSSYPDKMAPDVISQQEKETPPPPSADTVTINVPLTVPKEALIPGPDGKRIIDNFQVQMIPRGALVTTEDNVNEVVDNAIKDYRQKILPEGRVIDYGDSAMGKKIGKGRAILELASRSAGMMANVSLMGSAPAAWAMKLAPAAGAIGVVAGIDGLRKAYNMKAYFESKKAKGEQFEKTALTKPDGTTEVKMTPLDDLIKGCKDAIVVGWMNTTGSALTAAAGLGGGPACAIASGVVTLGAVLYAKRHAIAAKFKKIGASIGNKFQAMKNYFTGHKPAQAPAQPPTVTDVKKAGDLALQRDQFPPGQAPLPQPG
jgi:hypothetical protein